MLEANPEHIEIAIALEIADLAVGYGAEFVKDDAVATDAKGRLNDRIWPHIIVEEAICQLGQRVRLFTAPFNAPMIVEGILDDQADVVPIGADPPRNTTFNSPKEPKRRDTGRGVPGHRTR
jgi:hypothetical protein